MIFGRHLAGLVAAVSLLAVGACSPARSDLEQYERMPRMGASARAQETVRCGARDLVCARIVQMRGEACAATANDMRQTAEQRAGLRRCALDDARALPNLLPADAPAEDQERAALLVLDAWRAALDGGDPAADPASLRAATDGLRGMARGGPYAATLSAYATTLSVQTGRTPAQDSCAALSSAEQSLPASPASQDLKDRVASLRTAIASAKTRSCR